MNEFSGFPAKVRETLRTGRDAIGLFFIAMLISIGIAGVICAAIA